jgi:hypothetical protein
MVLVTRPLSGELRIDLDEAFPVWLVRPDGTALPILWPKGFGLMHTPVPRVVDEFGSISLSDGSPIEFRSIPDGTATGTPDAPFSVYGDIGNECYTSI